MMKEISSDSSFNPPVSIKLIKLSLRFPYFLSRVIPEKSATIADLDPVNMLKMVDLPTFGLPIIAAIDMAQISKIAHFRENFCTLPAESEMRR